MKHFFSNFFLPFVAVALMAIGLSGCTTDKEKFSNAVDELDAQVDAYATLTEAFMAKYPDGINAYLGSENAPAFPHDCEILLRQIESLYPPIDNAFENVLTYGKRIRYDEQKLTDLEEQREKMKSLHGTLTESLSLAVLEEQTTEQQVKEET